MSRWIIPLLLGFVALPCSAERVVDKPTGVSFEHPFDQYLIEDMSQGRALVRMYATPDHAQRVIIMSLPSAAAPEGMDSRRTAIARLGGPDYVEHRYEAATLAGLPAHALEYSAQGLRVLEVGAMRGAALLIVQVAAPEPVWKDPDQAAEYRAIPDTVRFEGEAAPEAAPIAPDLSTPEEVRAEWPARAAPSWRIAHHEVRVRLDPGAGSAAVEDDLTIEALEDGVGAIEVVTSVVTDVRFIHEGTDLPTVTTNGQHASQRHEVTLPQALDRGDTVTLRYTAHAQDYFQNVPNQTVAEVSVLGQVREHSSYTSHVLYYPVDDGNDATATLGVTVPEGYVVAAGGEPVGVTEDEDGTVTCRFENTLSVPRLLPFAWAVARYVVRSATTSSGMRISWYGYEGEDALLDQRLEVALQAAETFEAMMGPLPWGRVAFAHVTPEEREMGVSTPGLILVSDGFFGDFGDLDLTGRSVNDPEVLNALVVVDELSHQWNAYAVALPNEFAEGVATFLDLLWLRDQAGEETYRSGMAELTQAYVQSRALGQDVPVASPRVYQSPMYRTIAFAKVAVVLDMLMQYLGEDAFFEAWSGAFSALIGARPTYDEFFQALSDGAGENLTWFEEQWLLRAGLPQIQAEARDGELILEQVQPQDVFVLPNLPVRVVTPDGQIRDLNLRMDQRVIVTALEGDLRGAEVIVDPAKYLLVEQVFESTM